MTEHVARIWSDSDSTHELREYEQPPGRSSGSGVALAPWALNAATTYGTTPHMGNGSTGIRFESASQELHSTGLTRGTSEAVKNVRPTHYLCGWALRRSRTQCIGFIAVVAALLVCVVLACVLASRDEWYMTRKMWGADPEPAPTEWPFLEDKLPLRLVIVHHTGVDNHQCYQFDACADVLRRLQSYFLTRFSYDLPYNFLVGNDGRVYEGRGWFVEATHSSELHSCSIGLGFTGDYRRDEGTTRASLLQLDRTQQLLDRGVRNGMLHERYVVMAANSLRATYSPGDDLYDALHHLPHFNSHDRFFGMSCEDIYDELQALDDDSRRDQKLPALDKKH